MRSEWNMAVGTRMTRDERRAQYGGATYGGIEPSAQTPNVFVYSDPSRGIAYGYNFDGWAPDSDCFLYTGEGRTGAQTLTDGNKALINHREDGRALRIFVEDGTVEGSNTKIHRYLGEFEVDREEPYVWETAPDVNGNLRPVIVFRLNPIDAEQPTELTLSKTPEIAIPHVSQVPLESVNTEFAHRNGQDAAQVERRESQLVGRLCEFLEAQGCELTRWRLRPEGERFALFTDPFWVQGPELFEVKSTTSRESVRMAIGQLFDYRRFIGIENLKLTVVLPSRPIADLVRLLDSVGVGCVYEGESGAFHRASNSGNSSVDVANLTLT